MGKLLVDLDREALERVRVKLGARSHAEALRRLVWLHDIARDEPAAKIVADTSRAKVTNPGRPKTPYGSLLKKR